MNVMIGVDPHKGSHTAVAVDDGETDLGQLRVSASGAQLEQLLAGAVRGAHVGGRSRRGMGLLAVPAAR